VYQNLMSTAISSGSLGLTAITNAAYLQMKQDAQIMGVLQQLFQNIARGASTAAGPTGQPATGGGGGTSPYAGLSQAWGGVKNLLGMGGTTPTSTGPAAPNPIQNVDISNLSTGTGYDPSTFNPTANTDYVSAATGDISAMPTDFSIPSIDMSGATV
jgi:hypothetical protein